LSQAEARARVVVADDDPGFLEAVAAALEGDGRFEVVGLAANGEEAFQLACWQEPDVVVMDIAMPKIGGVEATRLLRRSKPRICVLMVSGDDPERLREARRAGAVGFVAKSRSTDDLADAIYSVYLESTMREARS
jgi:two-component system, NarL family, nitrate/nitrite response regulator NarL